MTAPGEMRSPWFGVGRCERSEMRPFDYVWNGQRITYYRNHAGEWHGAPATETKHYVLRAER